LNIHERRYQSYRQQIDTRLGSLIRQTHPKDVSDACRYVLAAGGKRIRAVLVLLSCEAVGGNARTALDASAAIEIMHNFTLVHDDVMDNAAARRGNPTVHTKWDLNTAILGGDVLVGLAYQRALKTNTKHFRKVLDVFTSGLFDVCVGQALDLEFERRSNVTLADYFAMIEKKTGRLISASTEIGALIGGGTEKHVRSLRTFGHYLGRAFQLQDDLLDVLADEEEFGKTIGGDIVEGKKTFLLLKSLEHANRNDRAVLMRVMHRKLSPPLTAASKKNEIRLVTAIYYKTGAIADARKRIENDTRRAEAALNTLPESSARETLLWLSNMLLQRNY
jgi:geranylgeranyl diphosphate synthase, type II